MFIIAIATAFSAVSLKDPKKKETEQLLAEAREMLAVKS